ncbi:DUF2155 domain-containing protein [Hasllibacter sp. MH4015]|uniref:DUF2155 domain-containing protein n=1 Tax=Hasllibacter sp. MH4015 TaxID=2854029 RepID=UPI001CD565BA|nr:DUF2155 domain-containing protein [Hasllibacter sp. MH4015]
MRRLGSICLAACLAICAPVAAQQFDNFDGDNTFEDFQLDSGDGSTELTISEDGGLIADTGGGDITLNLGDGGSQGSFESFPGVTGPVTSISQPPTQQGSVVSLRALDRLLGQPTDIELAIGQTVVFGRIAVRVTECRFPAGDPDGDAYAHLEVLDLEGQQLFLGWMIASSPALNALEHARYDVWVLGCAAA